MRVVFVCTGNTCRSPMAEGILKSLHSDFEVISRGLYVPEEVSASFSSIKAMEQIDIDISNHKSRQLTVGDGEDADLIITMTQGHKKTILDACPDFANKTFTLAEFAGESGDVSDPFGRDDEAYFECAKRIYSLISKADWSVKRD